MRRRRTYESLRQAPARGETLNHPIPEIDGYSDPREIGSGGFSRVFEALQIEFDRRVAVKVLNARLEDYTSEEAFERECRSMGALSRHPYIVTVLASAFTSGPLALHRDGVVPLGRLHDPDAPGRAYPASGVASARHPHGQRPEHRPRARGGARRREAAEYLQVGVRVPGPWVTSG